MGLITIPPIENGNEADDTLFNSRFALIANVLNGNIDGDNLAANAVSTAKVADGSITPTKLQTGSGTSWAWQAWTPTWTNLTVGNGVTTARYTQIGKTVHCFVKFVFGTTSDVTGRFNFTLPVPTAAHYINWAALGTAHFHDSGNAVFAGTVFWSSTTAVGADALNASGTYTQLTTWTTTLPFDTVSGDEFTFSFTYEAA